MRTFPRAIHWPLSFLLMWALLAGCASPPADDPVVSQPAYLRAPMPVYPAASRRLGEEGRCVILVVVLKDGTAGSARVAVGSGFPRLDAAALKSVEGARFSPARTRTGKAVDQQALLPITFKLDLPEAPIPPGAPTVHVPAP